jgi:uncharacterized membrane protein YdjX (TVP38/TMEM64 family)
LTLLAVLLVGVSVWLLAAGGPSIGDIRRAAHGAGWLGPLAFVAIYIGWTVLLLPGVVPTLAGGALFGLVVGSVLTLIGAVIGATLAFMIGRRLGRAQVQELASQLGDAAAARSGAPGWQAGGLAAGVRFDGWLRKRGFLALLYARLVPIVPFNLLNYAAGVAGMSTRSYVIATAVGIVPGTIAYTALGSAARHPGSAPFTVSLAAVVLLTLTLGALTTRRRRALSRG